MTFWLVVLAFIVIVYYLFIKGWFFKIIFFFFGWIGMYAWLWAYFPDSHDIAFRTTTHGYSWAMVIPSLACLFLLATTKE